MKISKSLYKHVQESERSETWGLVLVWTTCTGRKVPAGSPAVRTVRPIEMNSLLAERAKVIAASFKIVYI